MSWIENKHVCYLPFISHRSPAAVGAWWECYHCKLNWQVQSMVPDTKQEGMYKLTFTRREGDYIYTRSWMEE